MFKNIKDKLKLFFSAKAYRSEDNCNVDEKKPVKILKKQFTEEENDIEKLKNKLRRIAKDTKTYRIRKKNIKRLMSF